MYDSLAFPYARQNISKEDIEEVQKALSQPLITRGPLVEQFESAFSSYCAAKYAVAFNNGTSALMAAYDAANIGLGDFIISTPNTFISTIGAGTQRNATPVFIDIDRATGNFNLQQLSANLNRPSLSAKTAIVPVHFSGIPVDVEEIYHMIADLRTVIIEDAAHAVGSRYKDNSMVGSCKWSNMTIFSFHAAKTITMGEGGAVTTNDESLYHHLKLFRNNGMQKDPKFFEGKAAPWYYEVIASTGNFNLTEMQAALGLSQLKRIDSFIHKRQQLLQIYKEALKPFEYLRILSPNQGLFIAPHLCVVQINFEAYKKTRAEIMETLKKRSIGTQVHYIPIYRHPFFAKQMNDLSEYFPEMETYYAQALSLPLFYDLEEKDVLTVVQTLKEVLDGV